MQSLGEMGNNDYVNRLATVKGTSEIDGAAWTLYGHLSDLTETDEQATFRQDTPLEARVPLQEILKCASVYWFAKAADSYTSGDMLQVIDWLSEAHDALSLANGSYMWDEGARLEREETAPQNSEDVLTAARSALAKAAAQARHSENREMKAEVYVWLDANMASYKSMDAAAQSIIGQQPIVFRTARDWVGDWKKLRAAGKL